MVVLDLLPGTQNNTPTGISGDGSIIVGNSEAGSIGNNVSPFVWDELHGIRDLRQVLIEEHGMSSDFFSSNLDSVQVLAISSDGTTVGGRYRLGDERTGWMARLDRPLVVTSRVVGDFNGNGDLDVQDLDLLFAEIRSGRSVDLFDVNGDSVVDSIDRDLWVHDLSNTYFGDANLDGEFNSSDLVSVLAAGQYEDDIPGNSGWATGDWNGDAEFSTSDLVLAFQDGGYELGPRALRLRRFRNQCRYGCC